MRSGWLGASPHPLETHWVTTRRIVCAAIVAVAVVVLVSISDQASAQRRRASKIRLGTIAPKNSIYHQVLLRMRSEWREISGGTVDLTVYPGGVAGDELTMLRKLRAGQMQAALISGSGMSFLDEGISALQVPMMFDSYDEFDYVLEKMAPMFADRLAKKGITVLGWGDAGRAHFFCVEPFRTPTDLRAMKIYTAKGDAEMLRIYGEFGFRAVPLDLTELQANLETGLVEAFAVPPLVAAGYQWFGSAPNMLDMPFAQIVGALVIDRTVWETVPKDQRDRMLEVARNATTETVMAARNQERDAIREMQNYGLNVIDVDESTATEWAEEIATAYPQLRGRYAPAELMDEAVRWRDEFRAR